MLISTLACAVNPQNPQKELEALLKLANYTTWSTDYQEITIAIAAASPEEYNTAASFLKGKTLDNRQIKVTDASKCSSFANVNIVFILSETSVNVENLMENVAEQQILTVANNEKYLEQGCMFYINGSQEEIQYLFSKQAVLKSGLTIRSAILSPSHCIEYQ